MSLAYLERVDPASQHARSTPSGLQASAVRAETAKIEAENAKLEERIVDVERRDREALDQALELEVSRALGPKPQGDADLKR